jgi:hypothetical protein
MKIFRLACSARILSVVCVLLACSMSVGGSRTEDLANPRHLDVSVDAGADLGKMPSVFKGGMVVASWSFPFSPYAVAKYFKDIKPGVISIDIGNHVLRQSASLEDAIKRLKEIDPFVLEIPKHGGETVIIINFMPVWLSSKRDDRRTIPQDSAVSIANLSLPRELDAWARLVEAIVRHYKSDLGLDLRYAIWNEPDSEYWQGSEEEFFNLYRYSVLGARRADPKARIGGPGVARVLGQHWRKRNSTAAPMLSSLLQYCARTPLPELGLSRLPLDFVLWHEYGNPLNGYGRLAKQVDEWINRFGYAGQTEQMIGEWSSWEEQNQQQLSQERDQPYLASYAITALLGMDQAGIRLHAFSAFFEQQTKPDSAFSGGFGIFTKDFLIKPVYNAFKALSMLGDVRLRSDNTDPFIGVIAGKEGRTISAIVSNYVPRQWMVKQMPGQNSLLRLADQRLAGKTAVTVTFRNLPPASAFRCETYLIDSRHGNSFAAKDKIESIGRELKSPDGFSREVRNRLPAGTYSEADLAKLQQLLRNPARAPQELASMPPDQRNQLIKAGASIGERVIDSINEWPEIALTPAETQRFQRAPSLSVTLDLEPYAVALIVLKEERTR